MSLDVESKSFARFEDRLNSRHVDETTARASLHATGEYNYTVINSNNNNINNNINNNNKTTIYMVQ